MRRLLVSSVGMLALVGCGGATVAPAAPGSSAQGSSAQATTTTCAFKATDGVSQEAYVVVHDTVSECQRATAASSLPLEDQSAQFIALGTPISIDQLPTQDVGCNRPFNGRTIQVGDVTNGVSIDIIKSGDWEWLCGAMPTSPP